MTVDAERPPVTAAIGRFAAEVDVGTLPEEAAVRATMVLVDTVGCMVGGWSTEVAEPLGRYLSSRPESGGGVIVGSPTVAPVEVAALVNGTVGHALDYDDVVRAMPGHPSVAVLSVLAAESGVRPVTVAQVFEAYVIGVEVAVAIGRGMGGGHTRGWHPTAVCTGFGAVAALGRLRGLDAETTTRALGMVGSISSGLKHSFGTMTKPFHAGWSAHEAVVAVDLAMAGFTSATDIIEARGGFLDTLGDGRSDPRRIIERLGRPWVFAAPGVGIKVYPCCGASHRAIEATLDLAAASGLKPAEIEQLICRMPPGPLEVMPYPRPTTGLEGKFSLDYSIATALVDRSVTFDSFTDEAVHRPEVVALLDRITIVEDPDCFPPHPEDDPDRQPYEGFVEVTIAGPGGQRFSRSVEYGPGTPGRDLSWRDVATKFIDCAGQAGVGREPAEEALSALRDLGSGSRFFDAIAPLASTDQW